MVHVLSTLGLSEIHVDMCSTVHVCVCDLERSHQSPPYVRLICDASSRLGQKGLEDFKKQPFFKDVDWDNVRSVTPPYIPEYSSPNDTRNFEPLDEDADPTRHHAVSTFIKREQDCAGSHCTISVSFV